MTNLYVFGSGDCGQLGLGEDVDLKKRPTLHPFFADKNIVAVAAGGLHSLALSADGQVYSWGCNDEKALGHSCPEYTVGRVEGLDGLQIIQVAAGDSISSALTADGRVYSWGTFRDSRGVMGHHHDSTTLIQDRPMLIETLKAYKIIQIAAGSNHLMALTSEGQLYSWGCGEQGQLGRRVLERHKNLGLRPANITPRSGRSKVNITKVVCGSYHTLAISQDGNLYSMGLNNFGQLGLGDFEDRVTADLVEPGNWGGSLVVDASAGEHHSMVLLSTGQILTFGRADMGQLGVATQERAIPVPTHIQSAANISMIATGGHHNLAVSGNQVASWGFGDMHQLGHGPSENEKVPRAIETNFSGNIVQVAAGGQHSIVLTQ